MREIKFRAWVADHAPDYGDKPECVMFYSTRANTTHMKGDRELKCCGGGKPEGVLEYFLENPRTPVMQYTGLKDRNGKEIYEGDIVIEWEDDMEKVERFVVEWCGEDGYPAFDLKPNHFEETNALSFYSQNSDGYELEVIGNIYENGDLLQGNE